MIAINVFFCFPPPVVADFPEDPPNDPDYDRAEEMEPPGSIFIEQWNFFSFEPRSTPGAGISGVSADLAWKINYGRKDVILAVLDCGIRWNTFDLLNQFYINTGEVPEPRNSEGEWTEGEYDLNGDGYVNIQDYGEDSRVYDANGNGYIEPGDLISIFSDGVDDDGNGFKDDISGWDFWQEDNDPFDDVNFGHGTGGSLDAAAEGNNEYGGIGLAPGVSVLEVRVGDSFVVDANLFAQGLLYATDMGASTADASLGAINNSTLAREAIDYAWENGLLLNTSAADENSYHHNWPTANNHCINLGTIIPDNTNLDLSYP